MEMADQDSDEEDGPQPSSYVQSYFPSSSPMNEKLGVLPASPARPQIDIPKELLQSAIPHSSNDEEQKELQMAICLSTLEDVKRKLMSTTDEQEKSKLQKEFDDMKLQAKEMGLIVE